MANRNLKGKSFDELRKAAEGFKRGSAEAFHILYNEYNQKIYRFCLRMLGSPELAKDAFQDTFIKVFENRMTLRGQNFSAWLFKIARNVCLNAIRKNKYFEDVPTNSLSYSYVNNSDFSLNEFVQKAVLLLPVSFREALLLREYEEHTYEEIAEILGISVVLAKVRVHRARLLLKRLLEPIAKEYYGNR